MKNQDSKGRESREQKKLKTRSERPKLILGVGVLLTKFKIGESAKLSLCIHDLFYEVY